MLSAHLQNDVRAFVGAAFAAVDGAQFDDLPRALKAAQLPGRSLFLGQGGFEAQRIGPWLVRAEGEAAIGRLFEMLGDRPAAVFWSCSLGEDALYAHLRRLNGVVVPLPTAAAQARRDRAEREAEEYAETEADYADALVLFRHYDPRALSEVLTCLDADQIARLLGPADCLLAPDADGGEPLCVQASPWPHAAPTGALRLRREQMNAISALRLAKSRRKIELYLEKVAPAECARLGPALADQVRYADDTARRFGARSEYAVGLWAYLLITSRLDITKMWQVERVMTMDDPSTPDQRIEMLFDARVDAMRRDVKW